VPLLFSATPGSGCWTSVLSFVSAVTGRDCTIFRIQVSIDSNLAVVLSFVLAVQSEIEEDVAMAEVSSTQAAAIIGTSHVTIGRRVKDGSLKGRRQGLNRKIWVNLDDLRQFAAEYGYLFNEELANGYTDPG